MFRVEGIYFLGSASKKIKDKKWFRVERKKDGNDYNCWN